MKIVKFLKNAALGAAAGVSLLTALPVAGAVGTITATGMAVGSLLGATASVIDEVTDSE